MARRKRTQAALVDGAATASVTVATLPEFIARIAHEALYSYNAGLYDEGTDPHMLHWERTPKDVQAETIELVNIMLRFPEIEPGGCHESWRVIRERDGWIFGEAFDPANKRHPNLKPYAELAPAEQKKDAIFVSIVNALKGIG